MHRCFAALALTGDLGSETLDPDAAEKPAR
jgi:hypothetical protein